MEGERLPAEARGEKIYAIDFDGTIVENKFPEIGELKPEAETFIHALQERGDKWILYTMREGRVLDEALAFLREKGLNPDAVNDNLPEMCEFYHNNPRKVFANVYIDDHNAGGLLFSGISYAPGTKFARPADIFDELARLKYLAEEILQTWRAIEGLAGNGHEGEKR